MRLWASRPQESEYERVFATVQKAAAGGRQLAVDRKGNLKYRGSFSNFFLRCRVSFYSKKRYADYCGSERIKVRSAVLKKLEDVGKQARREAILSSRPASMDPESEKASLDDFLDLFIEIRQKGYENNELSQWSSNDDFNAGALDFLSRSKTVTYVREPVCPDFYDPGKLPSDHQGLTELQETQIRDYRESRKTYQRAAASKTIIEHTDFLEPPGPFPGVSQSRVRFLSEPVEKLQVEMDKHGGADADADDLERLNKHGHDVYVRNPVGATPRFSDGPGTVWNPADFKAHSEKRVLAETGKRKRLGQGLVGQDISAKAVDFLCFLRKNVQTQFTENGELPERLQLFFNENSAVSIQDSSVQPDRLVPSKKLATMAVNLCMGDTEEKPPVVAEKKALAFSDDIKVREIESRHADKRLLQFAVHDGQFETTRSGERAILGRHNRDSNPVTAEAAIDGVTHHYEEKSLPEEFEKHVPRGEKYPTATDRNDEGGLPAGSNRVGGSEETIGTSDRSWIQEQYASWDADKISHEESQDA